MPELVTDKDQTELLLKIGLYLDPNYKWLYIELLARPRPCLEVLDMHGLRAAFISLDMCHIDCKERIRRLTYAYGKRVLPYWEEAHPDDNTPHLALEASLKGANPALKHASYNAANNAATPDTPLSPADQAAVTAGHAISACAPLAAYKVYKALNYFQRCGHNRVTLDWMRQCFIEHASSLT